MPEVHFQHFSGLGLAAHHWSHRCRELAVDVAPHRGLGVLHPALLQQLVDHQEAVAIPAPSLDLVSARVERVAGPSHAKRGLEIP